jgi:hypothetical protein
MATYYGVNKTKARTPESGSSNIINFGQIKGKVRVMYDSYEAAGIAAGSIIELGDRLPKNCTVVGVELMTDAMGSSVTAIVGDYEDDNRYITVTTINTANLRTRLNAIDGLGYQPDETTEGDTSTDRQIILTTAGAAATGTIKIAIFYAQE